MKELHLTQAEVIRKADVSDHTVRNLMEAKKESYRPSSVHKVASALKWPADAIYVIADGGAIPEDEQTDGDLVARVRRLESMMDHVLAELEKRS